MASFMLGTRISESNAKRKPAISNEYATTTKKSTSQLWNFSHGQTQNATKPAKKLQFAIQCETWKAQTLQH